MSIPDPIELNDFINAEQRTIELLSHEELLKHRTVTAKVLEMGNLTVKERILLETRLSLINDFLS